MTSQIATSSFKITNCDHRKYRPIYDVKPDKGVFQTNNNHEKIILYFGGGDDDRKCDGGSKKY